MPTSRRRWPSSLVPSLVGLLLAAAPASRPGATAGFPAELAGAWAGTLSHAGESQDVFIELEPSDDGKVSVKLTLPVIHVVRTPMAKAVPEVEGDLIRIPPFTFRYDRASRSLEGTLPEALVPVYPLAFSLHRIERVDVASRPPLTAPVAAPAWTFDAGAPCWPGVTVAGDVVLGGCEDGQLHALDAGSGRQRWSFRAGGRIRARATVSGRDVYLQADDGVLYALDAADGSERWKVRLVDRAIERLPFDNPKSRFDRFGSEVTASGGLLYLGTHDGRIVAVRPADGAKTWEFTTGDSVLAAPSVSAGRLYAGSLDTHVYALDAATGRLLWKRDTRGGVVSTPAVEGGRLVVGNRAYDLLGLDAKDGSVAWTRYVWFSWVESSATIRDGVAYVGSSDAAALFAFDVNSGRPVWKTDVRGWAWGQPAVTADRVYIGTANQPGYLGGAHQGGAVAVDRRTGRPAWRVAVEPGKAGAYGFPGSPAVGEKLVYFAGLDGRIYAFGR